MSTLFQAPTGFLSTPPTQPLREMGAYKASMGVGVRLVQDDCRNVRTEPFRIILDSCFLKPALTWPARLAQQGAIRVVDFDDILKHLEHDGTAAN